MIAASIHRPALIADQIARWMEPESLKWSIDREEPSDLIVVVVTIGFPATKRAGEVYIDLTDTESGMLVLGDDCVSEPLTLQAFWRVLAFSVCEMGAGSLYHKTFEQAEF